MHKTIRESKMLEQVRCWRSEAFKSVRQEPPAARAQRAREWAVRLGLPMLAEDSEPRTIGNGPEAEKTHSA